MPETSPVREEPSMRYEGAPARRRRILDTLSVEGFLSVREIAAELGVSDMTVRRDLKRLESAGEVRVVHGGASLPHGTLRTPDFVARASHSSSAKQRMADVAVSLVEPGETIAVDAGTTSYAVATALPEDLPGCVVTHSVPVVQLMLGRQHNRVVVLGGDLLIDSQAFVGPMSVQAAESLRVRTFFLGAGAVDAGGVYVDADLERPTKLALMSAADRIVLLADATKFGRSAPVKLCGWERIDVLVTDSPAPWPVSQVLRAAEVDVITSP